MTLKTIVQAAITSSKTVIPKTMMQNPSSSTTIALPLSSMAVAYASSLPSKPLQEQPQRIAVENHQTKRFYQGTPPRSTVMIQASTDQTIDPFLGNLLEGFCNGSCYEDNMR